MEGPQNIIGDIVNFFEGREGITIDNILQNFQEWLHTAIANDNFPESAYCCSVNAFYGLLSNHKNGDFRDIGNDPQIHIITIYVETIFMSKGDKLEKKTKAGDLYKKYKLEKYTFEEMRTEIQALVNAEIQYLVNAEI